MKRIIVAALLALLLLGATPAAADTSTEVSGNTVDVAAGENGSTGWWFGRDAGYQTPFSFTTDQARIGDGSLHVAPIGSNPTDKFIAELFLGEPMSSFSIDYLTSSRPADFYLSVYANTPAMAATNPGNFYQCRFNFHATGNGGWKTLSTASVPSIAKRSYTGPCVLADMVVRVVAVNVGQSTATDVGTSGYLDNAQVVTASGTHVYDFEPAPQTKDDCKDGGWAHYGYRNQGACVSALASGK